MAYSLTNLKAMAQAVVQLEPSLVKFCEIDLFRKVLDPSSLEVFWTELTAGAYGTIDRADGLLVVPFSKGPRKIGIVAAPLTVQPLRISYYSLSFT